MEWRVTGGLLVVAACLPVTAWAAHRIAAGTLPPARPGGRLAVLVLGYPSQRSGRTHPLQRWRVDIAARTAAAHPDAILIFTGGTRTAGREPEAAVMAADARTRYDLPSERIRLETAAHTTWENVALSAPLLVDVGVDQIAIASDPLHVARAARYLRQRSPELAGRLVAATGYRPLEHPWLELLTAGYEALLALRFGRRAAVRSTKEA